MSLGEFFGGGKAAPKVTWTRTLRRPSGKCISAEFMGIWREGAEINSRHYFSKHDCLSSDQLSGCLGCLDGVVIRCKNSDPRYGQKILIVSNNVFNSILPHGLDCD